MTFRRVLVIAFLALIPSLAVAQIIPSGNNFTPGHTVQCLNQTCTVAVDAGGAAGSSLPGQGYLTELGITATGTPVCINDALTSGPYHQLCLGANAFSRGLISYNAYGGASALPLSANINGTFYDFPITLSGILGPNSSVIGDVPCFNNTTGSLLSNGCPTARFLNPSTAPITSSGALVLAINDNATTSAAQIYAMAFGGSVSTYDMIRSVAVVPSGSSLLSTNGVAAYLLNQNASIGGGTSQNAVSLFGVAVGAVSNAATWGGNVLVTDNTAQSVSAFHNQKLTGFEIDVNAWDTTTGVYGLLIAGASGQQPTVANAILISQMDITGGNRAKWTTGLQVGSGSSQIGVLIGTTSLSGNSLSSMPLDFFSTSAGGALQTYTLAATPTSFTFGHTFGGVISWSFDANIAMPASTAVIINSDNALTADSSHDLFLGLGASILSVTIGNTTASVTLTGNNVVAPQLPTQAHAGGNACVGYNGTTKAFYVSSTVTTC